MEESVVRLAPMVATAIEAVMVLILVVGALQALAAMARLLASRAGLAPAVREAWLDYAAWILLALEFALAADLIRTVIAPTWDEVGKLATIAAIRTALGWFLGRDIAEFRGIRPEARPGP
jgi:uncharacterized membrane protein